MTGRLLDGRYRIGSRIARGGMAAVYEAADLRLDRIVAVKVMHEGLGDDAEFAERFVREARAAAQISHPNVVAVFDQGDDQGTLFLAMEYIRGHTLRDVIRSEAPMSPSRALALLEPVVAALAAAHRAGLIHRDVKPENVLIAHDGRIKVADFGLAKAVSADTQHTATGGVLIGTVSYLAPELVVEGRADPRADVYATGVILYELLTGVKPHEGESPIQVAYKHVHEDVPPPSEKMPRLPSYVDALVSRATARDRTLRPADAGILLHQLRRVAQALADGVTDDPELTADLALTPRQIAAGFGRPEQSDAEAFAGDEAPDEASADVLGVAADEAAEDTGAQAFALPAAAAGAIVGLATLPTAGGADEPYDLESDGGLDGPGAEGKPAFAEPDTAFAEPDTAFAESNTAFAGQTTAFADPTDTTERAAVPVAAAGATDEVARALPPWSDLAVALRDHTAPIVSVPSPGVPPPATATGAGSREPAPVPVAAAPRPPRPRRRWRGPLLLALAVLLVASVAVGAWWFGSGRYTQAPAVIGLREENAIAKIEDAGLVAEVTAREYDEQVAVDKVISADPVAGTKILDGGTIGLVVSLGKERYDVPKLVGLTEDQAQDRIADRNLVFGTSTGEWSETVKEGVVISQTPKAGRSVKRDTVVDLVISKGRQPIRFADWTGESAAEAKAALEAKGLVVDDSALAYSDSVPEGFIISQAPKTGTLFRGDTVTLVVSRGPELVEVPRDGVIAAGVDAATATLEELGFQVKVRKDPTYIGLGFVLRSDPSPGTLVVKGSTITIFLI